MHNLGLRFAILTFIHTIQWDVHCMKLTAGTYIYTWYQFIDVYQSRYLYVQVVGFIKFATLQLMPSHPNYSTYTPHLADMWWHFAHTATIVRVMISIGRLVLLYSSETSLSFWIWLMHGTTVHSKTITLFMNFFSWKPHSGSIVYWYQEFWTTDTGWHFEDWRTWYNYTLFIWVIFQEQKTLIIIGKQCYRNDA